MSCDPESDQVEPVNFKLLAKTQKKHRAVVTFDDNHWKWDGIVTIEHMTESWKYGEEIQIKMMTYDKPTIECSRSGKKELCKIEINLPPEDALSLLKTTLEKHYGKMVMIVLETGEIIG